MDGRRRAKKRVQSICSECGRLAEEEARAIAEMDAARDAVEEFLHVGLRLSRHDAIIRADLELDLFQAQLAYLYAFRCVEEHLKFHGRRG